MSADVRQCARGKKLSVALTLDKMKMGNPAFMKLSKHVWLLAAPYDMISAPVSEECYKKAIIMYI